jgi:hypothetical protein
LHRPNTAANLSGDLAHAKAILLCQCIAYGLLGLPIDLWPPQHRPFIPGACEPCADALLNHAPLEFAETPLHFAAREYQLGTAQRLIEGGANPNAQDNHGNTPLWRAVFESRGRGEMIKLLLSTGADKAVKNKHGSSPKDLANTIGIMT